MANIKSQKKRIITNEKARMRNRAVRSELKTAIRVVREAVEAKDGATAYAAALKACRLLDKAASKGIIHKRQAANRKSGVMKLANTVVTAEDIAAYKPAEKKVAPSNGNKKAAAKAARKEAMQKALKEATLVPYSIMELCLESLKVTEMGLGCTNTNAASDLGVASLNLKSAVQGAWLNVLINLGGIRDEAFVNEYKAKGEAILAEALPLADKIYNEILASL